MSRLTKSIKLDLINNLINDIFSGREADLKSDNTHLFHLILASI